MFNITDKLLNRLHKTEVGYWEFVGARNTKGYGNIVVNGITKRAHRIAYEHFCGPIQDGLMVCHVCDNPPCCNPNHLFLGTNQDNVTDSTIKDRRADQAGSNNGNNKLNESAVIEIRKLYSDGYSQKDLSCLFNVSNGCIGFIVRRETWKHVA